LHAPGAAGKERSIENGAAAACRRSVSKKEAKTPPSLLRPHRNTVKLTTPSAKAVENRLPQMLPGKGGQRPAALYSGETGGQDALDHCVGSSAPAFMKNLQEAAP